MNKDDIRAISDQAANLIAGGFYNNIDDAIPLAKLIYGEAMAFNSLNLFRQKLNSINEANIDDLLDVFRDVINDDDDPFKNTKIEFFKIYISHKIFTNEYARDTTYYLTYFRSQLEDRGI